MSLEKTLVAGLLVLGGLAGSAPLCGCHGRSPAGTPALTANAQKVTLHIEGMDCTACTAAVSIALKKLDGVEAVQVSFTDKQAVVEYDPDKVTPGRLADAVDQLGYQASIAGKRS